MVEEWLSIAEKENLVKPSVYQGQYNLLCRGYETELFPLLRKRNISFVAFSPLAGGFLLGNFTADGVQGGSRFAIESPFKTWYDRPSMHEAIKRLKAISDKTGLGMDELSLRWLAHHSIQQEQDGIILGASKVAQISKNVAQIRNGPLDEGVAKELSRLWESVKEDGMKIIDYSSAKA
jgi:aflatoxin B1 aldehyde reductase